MKAGRKPRIGSRSNLVRIDVQGKQEAIYAVHDRLELMIPQIAARNGIDEALKAENPLEWAAQMNLCKAQAEEVVLDELIYD